MYATVILRYREKYAQTQKKLLLRLCTALTKARRYDRCVALSDAALSFFAGKGGGRMKLIGIEDEDHVEVEDDLFLTLDQLDLVPEDLLLASKEKDDLRKDEYGEGVQSQPQRDQFKASCLELIKLCAQKNVEQRQNKKDTSKDVWHPLMGNKQFLQELKALCRDNMDSKTDKKVI